MDGVIVINKPIGKTSHDMVYFVRRLVNVKRVGHTGTLDPDASGVLPVCIGKATRASDMLTFSDKAYTAELVLGMTTDTLDADGEILTECEVTCTEDEIRTAILSFVGEIEQIPPMYSAIKQNGKKLYQLARAGIEVEREKRKVTIYSIDVLEIDMEKGTVKIDVSCSKGTYIRTLCEDIGMKLGCGAYMNTLVRTKSSMFTLEQSHTLDELLNRKQQGTLNEVLISVDTLFCEYEKIVINDVQRQKVTNGMRIKFDGLCEDTKYRVYDEEKNFLCISTCIDGELVIYKSFWTN